MKLRMLFMGLLITNYIYSLNLNILLVNNEPYKTFTICVESENSAVQDLKEAIERARGIPVERQRIFKNFGKIYESELYNRNLLQDYEIREGGTLALRIVEQKNTNSYLSNSAQ